MSTRPTPLATYARVYTTLAQPVPGVTATTGNEADQTEVEVRIDTRVYTAAATRAAQQDQTLAAVSRAVLFRVASAARPDPGAADRPRPPLRTYGIERYRHRFSAPRGAYEEARDAILASGRTVAAAVEAGLASYARTGHL